MKRYICILIVLLNLTFEKVFAHEDWYYNESFGNVKTSILTGFKYEEINKVAIFGQLAEKMSKELNYSGLILLDFNHTYTRNIQPDFFISFDSISYWDENSKKWLIEQGIVIRQFAKHFQAQTTLKLLEYAISNPKNIESTQRQVEYKNHYNFKIISIDTLIIEKILSTPNSKLLNNILQQRIDRPEEDFKHGGISYYWQNNNYYVFVKYMWWNKEEQSFYYPEYVLFDIENVYDFHRFKNWSAVIFDTDSSFYSIKQSALVRFGDGTSIQEHKPQVSQRHVIENTFGYYRPFKVENIGGDKVSINFQYYSSGGGWQPRERILIYLVEEDELIQDLDELLKKR